MLRPRAEVMTMVQVVRYAFTVDEYHKMAQAGIFTEDDRVELLDGEIVEMTPIGSRHADAVDRINRLMQSMVGGGATIRVQNPVRLSEASEPQPDVVLARRRSYRDEHPGPDDVFLLIEVADTTADFDQQVKVPLYARAGIREVWLVDLASQSIEVLQRPSRQGYREVVKIGLGQRLSPLAFPDVALAVEEIVK